MATVDDKNNELPIAGKRDLIACVACACVFLFVAGLLFGNTTLPVLYICLISVFGYLAVLSLYAAYRFRHRSPVSAQTINRLFHSELGTVCMSMDDPITLCDADGRILWGNRAMAAAFSHLHIRVGTSIEVICGDGTNAVPGFEDMIRVGDEYYRHQSIPTVLQGKNYYLFVFHPCTELYQLYRKYDRENTVIGYVFVDNLDDILQYVQEELQNSSVMVKKILEDWAESMNGLLKAYDRNRYMLLIDRGHLQECRDNQFSILDKVRGIRVGDSMSITVSIGISDAGDTLPEREAEAQAALAIALQRGGDQAVCKNGDAVRFYGGKTKGSFKRANINARVIASKLTSLIVRADRVLIMGHRYGDYDSFGAAIGIARLCMSCGVDSNIVINTRDTNLTPCFERVGELEDYRDIFIDGTQALDLQGPDTLLVVVDVNNFEHAECSELTKKVATVAVIDHHRRTAPFASNVVLEYIEPSASSASEMIAEMLEQQLQTRSLLKEEAELLMSGILLDTKQFTRNTGTRTFNAAAYLRGEGASLNDTNSMFKADVDELVRQARFNSNVMIYKHSIAIASCEGNNDAAYRITAAKVSDALLAVRGVEASFSVVCIDDKVHISARSNGSINVQLILEELGGGGHYDVAGAQIGGQTVEAVLQKLKIAIDKYTAA